MSKKFTDEEVVKAALCCTVKSCETCPFRDLGTGLEECIIKFSEYISNNTKNEPAPTADVQEVKHGYWQNKYRSGTTIKEGVVSSCCDMWNNRKS